MDQVFPGVDFEGGACYFLWDRDHEGLCAVTTMSGEDVIGPVERWQCKFFSVKNRLGLLQGSVLKG
jgi:hypothetical protein